jgi:hypothetical protein
MKQELRSLNDRLVVSTNEARAYTDSRLAESSSSHTIEQPSAQSGFWEKLAEKFTSYLSLAVPTLEGVKESLAKGSDVDSWERFVKYIGAVSVVSTQAAARQPNITEDRAATYLIGSPIPTATAQILIRSLPVPELITPMNEVVKRLPTNTISVRGNDCVRNLDEVLRQIEEQRAGASTKTDRYLRILQSSLKELRSSVAERLTEDNHKDQEG